MPRAFCLFATLLKIKQEQSAQSRSRPPSDKLNTAQREGLEISLGETVSRLEEGGGACKGCVASNNPLSSRQALTWRTGVASQR